MRHILFHIHKLVIFFLLIIQAISIGDTLHVIEHYLAEVNYQCTCKSLDCSSIRSFGFALWNKFHLNDDINASYVIIISYGNLYIKRRTIIETM